MARVVSLTILSTLIVILGLTFFRVLAPFVLPLFLAGVTTLLVQPVFQKMIVRFQGRVRLAAGVLSTGVLLAILVPLAVGTLLASLELYTIANTVTDEAFIQKATKAIKGKTGELDVVIDRAVEYANSYLPANRQADKVEARAMVRQQLRETLTGIGDRSLGSLGQTVSTTVSKTVDIVGQLLAATVAILVALTIYVIALYYFLADGPELIAAAETLIPVHVDYQRDLLSEFAKAVRSVVLATFMAAIAQGVATTVALEVLGFGHLLVILTLSIIFSLIPLAGAWIVWAPFALSLFASGHWIQASLLTVYGLVVVGMLDNVVRAYVLNSDTKLHPLLALASVLGGIQTMGLWGVFIGPIVASCLYALMRIFNTELFALSRERFGLTLEGPRVPAEAATPGPASPVVSCNIGCTSDWFHASHNAPGRSVMKWMRWLTMWSLLCGAFAGAFAKDEPAEEAADSSETLSSDENADEAPAEQPFKVSLTDKWSVLVNPVKPRKGVVELSPKSPIQNVGEFTFTGPMVGHPFGLGDFAADGRWALVDGIARPVDGSNALIHLAGADQFELEGIIHQEKFGGWLLLLGWNQGHGYSLSNVTLKESGSPWFICEYRGSKAIESTNNEVKHFEWKNDQPLHIGLRDKLTVIVGKTAIIEDYPLENYTPGDLFWEPMTHGTDQSQLQSVL